VQTGSGWYIRINSAQRYWTYFHIFNDNVLPIVSSNNRYELRQATLEDPTGENESEPRSLSDIAPKSRL
ncbi:MAG: hypothetical protein J7L03_05060, partial [Caldisericaceae bacterium]|nr:hypothetical protein [Caldisericaceae bacterium]